MKILLSALRLAAAAALAALTGLTLLDCAGILGYYSTITLPLLVGLMWVASRRSGPYGLALWTFLAGASGWRIGQMIDCAYLQSCGALPFAPIVMAFSLTFLFVVTSGVADAARNARAQSQSSAD